MVLWIGVDDTDSLQGMCTTFLAAELVAHLTERIDLIGFPRLVRLNPNVPWKTRGNGAVCLRVGRGRGTPQLIGELHGRRILMFPRERGKASPTDIVDLVAADVERWSSFDEEGTNPGFVVLPRPAQPHLYWAAVRRIVTKEEALAAAPGSGIVREYKNGRGLIGALAATSWRPRDRTYEVLCYRDPTRWGTRRVIDPQSVIEMDSRFGSTFNNYDYDNDRVVIAPHTPCPILFGIRGDDGAVLPEAMRSIRGERPQGWLVFETNQGTDDHVTPAPVLEPRRTIRFAGVVSAAPRNVRGGHVVVEVGGIDVTAYEPSKQFRSVVRRLRLGDQVEVVGAVRDKPRTLNLEKLNLLDLGSRAVKIRNPMCNGCGRRAKSMGYGTSFRCATCRRRFPRSAATFRIVEPAVGLGWYEPPVGSRRHLSKPLKRTSRDRTHQTRVVATG
jgi:tRNA(Ile2)-agmatinylcytidine synthase